MGGLNQSSSLACSPQKPFGIVLGRSRTSCDILRAILRGALAELLRRRDRLFIENVRIELQHGPPRGYLSAGVIMPGRALACPSE